MAEQSFNLVHLPRSQDLSFSVVNLGSQAALLNLELYDDAGSLRQAVTQPVGVGQQYARYLADPALFGSAADDAQRWVRGFVTVPETYGFWLANDGSTLNYLDGLPLGNVRDAQVVLRAGHVAESGRFRASHPAPIPISSRRRSALQLVGGGSVKAAIPFTLAGVGAGGGGRPRQFPAMAADDYLYVQADRPLLGCELYGDGQKLAALSGLAVPSAATTLYCPHVASGNLGVMYETWLTLVNPTEQDIAVVMQLLLGQRVFFGIHHAGDRGAGPELAVPITWRRCLGHLPRSPARWRWRSPGTRGGNGGGGVRGGGGGTVPVEPAAADGGRRRFLVGHIANGTLGFGGLLHGAGGVESRGCRG